MAGALKRYWENQYAGVVGDFQRKAAYLAGQAEEAKLQAQWADLGDRGKAECADPAAYMRDHPEVKTQEDWVALLQALDKPVTVAILLPYASYDIYRNGRLTGIRSTLEEVRTRLGVVRANMDAASMTALDSVTKADYGKDFADVIAEIDDHLATVPKPK